MMLEQLQEIFDWIYMQSEPESLTVHLGIWDAGETPYTFFAVVTNQNGAHILGEASYGCGSLEEAVQALYEYCIVCDAAVGGM
jgi:3-isopropylmalate dehydratase small subunit